MPQDLARETVAEAFQDYADHVLSDVPPDSPKYIQIRATFYAGYWSSMQAMKAVTDLCDTEGDDAAVEVLKGRERECEAMFAEMAVLLMQELEKKKAKDAGSSVS